MNKIKLFIVFALLLFATIPKGFSQTTFKSNTYRMNNVLISKDVADTKPALLETENVKFIDANNNDRIDANESCYIEFVIINNGNGNANNVRVTVTNKSNVKGLEFNESLYVGKIEPKKSQKVKIPISGSMYLTTGSANLQISFDEAKGFQPDPINLNISTKEFAKPDVKVVDYSFLSDNGNLKIGYPIQLKVLIQNVGQGTAQNVKVSFSYPTNVYLNGDVEEFFINELLPGGSKTLIFEFQANKKYTATTIPINVKIEEKYGQYAQGKELAATVDAQSSGKTINIASNATNNEINIVPVSLTADVDKNIPKNSVQNIHRFALIFGNEDYTSKQPTLSKESNVNFAVNDAKIFQEYCLNILGIPARQILFKDNATKAEMTQLLDQISLLIKAEQGNAEVFFYYSGHGMPLENTKEPYLIPVDVSGANVGSGVKLMDVYTKLTENSPKQVTVFLDACFSGNARNMPLLSQKTMSVNPEMPELNGNIVIFASSDGIESSGYNSAYQHGYFTYFLLKKLQETAGNVNYGDLYNYIKSNVAKESILSGKPQNPVIIFTPSLKDVWKNWSIK